jgi:DNA-binding NarL/FixJ family response regulator
MSPIKVLLVDDHEIFRNGLKELITKETDLEVAGEASSGEEALTLLSTTVPDVLIMDIRMPGINGVETAEKMLRSYPDIKIIMFSLYDNEEYIIKALSLGAKGYLLKDTSNKIFLSAIRAVYKGEYYYIGEVSDKVIRHFKSNQQDSLYKSTEGDSKVNLSKREEEILKLIRAGNNSKEIAEALSISVRTIDAHRLNILRKFSVNSMEEVLMIIDQQKG